MRKYLGIGILVLAVAGGFVWYQYADRIARVGVVGSLFTGAEQYENFNRLHELFPHKELPPSGRPFKFETGATLKLPSSFRYRGEQVKTSEFLERTDTSALLILDGGKIRFEQYWLTGGPDVTWLSMSVAKSFISALLGIAVEQGHIRNIEDAVTIYVPELKGSAYDGVRIKDIMQMSSGALWNEDYGDPESDINRFGGIFALGGSMNEFAASLVREREPGTFNQYNSTDTQVLGMLLTNATGRPITDYMIEMLWHPMGAENHSFWLADSENMEMAFGGLNATARDYAKLGEMYRLGGKLNGKQIVPSKWVRASITPDAPHLLPGDNPASDSSFGYGYQWWIPEGDRGEFTAIGVYNQFIYVSPKDNAVIVKLSANSSYGTPDDAEFSSEFETIEFFRAITALH